MAVGYGAGALDNIKRSVNVQAHALLLHILFDLLAELDDLGGVCLHGLGSRCAVDDRHALGDESDEFDAFPLLGYEII